jgi:hypothetical protein
VSAGVYSLGTGGTSSGSGANFIVGEQVIVDVLGQVYDPVQPDPNSSGLGTWSYDYSSTVTTGLASGNMRFNNADPSLATECYIWESCREGMTHNFADYKGSKLSVHLQISENKAIQFTVGFVTALTNKYTLQMLEVDGAGSWPSTGLVLAEVNPIPSSTSYGTKATNGGFVDHSDCTMVWTEGTRTLNLNGTYDIVSGGATFTKTNDSIVIPDTEGPKWAYYDNTGTLTLASTFSDVIGTSIDMRSVCLVAGIYWNATDNQAEPQVVEMMHSPGKDPSWWRTELRTSGSKYLRGGTFTSFVIGDGSLATHAQFSVSGSAQMYMAEKYNDIDSRAVGDNIAKLWRSGTSSGGFWRSDGNVDSYVVETTGGGRAAYNQYVSGGWSLTECTDGYHVWSHICALPGLSPETAKYVVVVGRGEYLTKKEAENAVVAEVSGIRTETANGFLHTNLCPIASILCQTKIAYTNTPNTRIVRTTDDLNFIDWRATQFPPNSETASFQGAYPYSTIAYSLNNRYSPHQAAVAPVAGDDAEDNFIIGDIWINTALDDAYICTDNTVGAAVWKIIAT